MLQAFVHVKELMQFLAPSRRSVLEERGSLEASLVPALPSACSTAPRSPGFTPSLYVDVPSSEGPSWQHCMTNLSDTPLYFLFPYVVFFFFIAFIIAWHIYGFVSLFFPINIGTLWYIPIYPQHREPYLRNNCLMNEQNKCSWKSSSQLSLTSSVALAHSLLLLAALRKWKGWTRSSPYEGSSRLPCFLPFEFCWSVCLVDAYCASLLAVFWRKHFWKN